MKAKDFSSILSNQLVNYPFPDSSTFGRSAVRPRQEAPQWFEMIPLRFDVHAANPTAANPTALADVANATNTTNTTNTTSATNAAIVSPPAVGNTTMYAVRTQVEHAWKILGRANTRCTFLLIPLRVKYKCKMQPFR